MEHEFLITIATYNEVANLPRLIDQLFKLIPNAQVLIVDDDSPDFTWKTVEEHPQFKTKLFLIRRMQERGLGSATLAGIRWGIENGYAFIGTMDADFSHPPEVVGRLFETIRADDEIGVAIGSRYVKGGGIVGWPLRRRVASKWINWLSRFWLGLKTSDNTGALRIYRAKTLERVGLSQIQSVGYAYLEEILLILQRANVKFVEVPYTFVDRELGNSKLTIAKSIAVMRELIWMKFRSGRDE